jgi:hypothetical protein
MLKNYRPHGKNRKFFKSIEEAISYQTRGQVNATGKIVNNFYFVHVISPYSLVRGLIHMCFGQFSLPF